MIIFLIWEEEKYAKIGSFIPSPAANTKPVGNQNAAEYSVIHNLGPLRIHEENSGNDQNLYENL